MEIILADIQIQRAKLSDAQRIADFVSRATPNILISPEDVMMRFGMVGFLIALQDEDVVAMVGWQVENLVIQVTDFLMDTHVDRDAVGRSLVSAMEEQGLELQAEASILCLPPNPNEALIAFWEQFGYAYKEVGGMYRAWRDAIREWSPDTEKAMVKSLRNNVVLRPM